MGDQARQLRDEISDLEQRITHFPAGSPEWITLEKQRVYKSALHMRFMFMIDDAMRPDGEYPGTFTRSGKAVTPASPLADFIQVEMDASRLSEFGETVKAPNPKGCLSTSTILTLLFIIGWLAYNVR